MARSRGLKRDMPRARWAQRTPAAGSTISGSLPPRIIQRPVPAKYEKRAWTLGGRILAPDLVDDRIFNIASWNINLSNGDLV
jgi:hypothetical protein